MEKTNKSKAAEKAAGKEIAFIMLGGRICRQRLSKLSAVIGCEISFKLRISNYLSVNELPEEYLDWFIGRGSEAIGTALKLLSPEELMVVADDRERISTMLDKDLPAGNYWVQADGERVVVNMATGEIVPDSTSASVILKM